MFRHSHEDQSYIRVFHAVPTSIPIDVYIDKKAVAPDFLYEDFTEYIPIAPGEHTISITKANEPTIIYERKINLAPKSIYTAIAAPKCKNPKELNIFLLEDTQRPIPANNLLLRFGHFSKATPIVDITLPDGTPVFKNMAYGQVTQYIPLAPGVYTLEARDPQTGKVLLTIPDIRLKGERFYSIYAVGDNTKQFPLQVVIPLDGNSYLKV